MNYTMMNIRNVLPKEREAGINPKTAMNRQSKLEKIISFGRAPKSGELLELGCGAGNIGLWFAGLEYSVSGIDISPTAVNLAQKRAKESSANATFCTGNVLDLKPFADETFDFVYRR